MNCNIYQQRTATSTNMMVNPQQSSLLTQLQLATHLAKMTPEQRKMEVRRQMFAELKQMEMERRQRDALETMEKEKREREEKERAQRHAEALQEAKQRKVEERRALEIAEAEKLKQELMKLKEQEQEVLLQRTKSTISALKKEQQESQEEAELRHLPQTVDNASPECPTSDLMAEQQRRNTPLINNWVGGVTDAVSRPDNHIALLFMAKPAPEYKGLIEPKQNQFKTPKKLTVEYWLEKYQAHREKKSIKRSKKAEEEYARWSSFKASRAQQLSRYNCYTDGFDTGRRGILKSMF